MPDSPPIETPSPEHDPRTPAPEAAAPEAAPTAPTAAAELAELRARYDADRAETRATLQLLREGFTHLAASQARPATVAEPELSDEQIEQAIAEGKGAGMLRELARREAARATAQLQREAVDPLAARVNGAGMTAIARHAIVLAKPDMPYYERYRGEIDRELAKMSDDLKLEPGNIRYVHDIIAGGHIQELLAEERERVTRQFRDDPTSLPGLRPTAPAGPKVPSAEELFGRGSTSARMVRDAGGEEAFVAHNARRNKAAAQTWAEYVARYQAMHGTEGTA
jgi:hypothetical protein